MTREEVEIEIPLLVDLIARGRGIDQPHRTRAQITNLRAFMFDAITRAHERAEKEDE